ncbi:DUF4399 domain-containing protein [Enterovibrio baiacu]|uniref:DUF4399 domain-containing protein n=1 Tax=Enterovibrio baiacu TaxID=2491023 RepID=UPI0010130A28|nr:DUF4399 domain-containing protein [Enterovibrio baiacu]MBE1276671.1 DUF4399 domain-containing protein [Enterovibrio baiacu]
MVAKIRRQLGLFSFLVVALFVLTASLSRHVLSATQDASVYFISPQDGDMLPHQFEVVIGVGDNVRMTGRRSQRGERYHVLINLDALGDFSAPLPKTGHIRHLSRGEQSVVLTLPSGKHTLQVLVGDEKHIPLLPPVMSEIITIHVR